MQGTEKNALLEQLEKLHAKAKEDKKASNSPETIYYYDGKIAGYASAIQLVRSIQVSRSSTEPKVQ